MIRLLPSLVLSLALALPAHAGKRVPLPDVVEDASAYATTDREKAARLLEDAVENAEEMRVADRPAVWLHAGEQRRLLGHTDKAHKWFSEAEGRGEGSIRASARLGLALLDAIDGLDSRVVGLLLEASDKEVLATQNADRYLLLSRYANAQNDARKEREYTRKALSFSREDQDVAARVEAAISHMSRDESVATESVEVAQEAGEALGLLQRAEAALADGRDEKARALATEAANSSVETEARAGQYFLRRLDAGPVVSGTVGVLLPLSGKYEVAGKQVRQALELGFKASGRTLVFKDSGSSPESAVAALEELVFGDRAVAVVGPLLTDESQAVREAAEAMRVPLVSLSQSLEVREQDEFLVQGQVTPGAQVSALLDHVTTEAGMKRFAIFAPDNNYGRAAAEAFLADTKQRGLEVTVVEYYDATATDLIPFASRLGRKDYEARAAEFREIRKETEERGGNPDRVVLPPELDFDGLFVPDNHKRLPIACAALAYEEFPIGEFQVNRDGPTIPLLGLSGWNHPDLVTRGGLYTRSSVFVDSFWRAELDADPFVQTYRDATGRSPSALEANAYDIGRLVAEAARSDARSRMEFLAALHEAEIPGDVSGLTGVTDDGVAERSFRVLSMDKDNIFELLPEPVSEDATDE